MNCPNCNYDNVVEARFCANCGASLITTKVPPPFQYHSTVQSPQSAKAKGSGCGGISIALAAGCFVLFIIFGIVAAIMIPSLLNTIQRDKQKQTIADMNLIADILEDYFDTYQQYPDAKSMSELKAALVPNYLKTLPEKDAREIISATVHGQFSIKSIQPLTCLLVLEKMELLMLKNITKAFVQLHSNNDIVLSDGTFWQYPESFQP